jgi:hypothetical protein
MEQNSTGMISLAITAEDTIDGQIWLVELGMPMLRALDKLARDNGLVGDDHDVPLHSRLLALGHLLTAPSRHTTLKLGSVSIDLVVEDGTDRAVGERADLDGTPRRTKLFGGADRSSGVMCVGADHYCDCVALRPTAARPCDGQAAGAGGMASL